MPGGGGAQATACAQTWRREGWECWRDSGCRESWARCSWEHHIYQLGDFSSPNSFGETSSRFPGTRHLQGQEKWRKWCIPTKKAGSEQPLVGPGCEAPESPARPTPLCGPAVSCWALRPVWALDTNPLPATLGHPLCGVLSAAQAPTPVSLLGPFLTTPVLPWASLQTSQNTLF